MKYIKPEIEWICFENSDILTISNEGPVITFGEGDFNE